LPATVEDRADPFAELLLGRDGEAAFDVTQDDERVADRMPNMSRASLGMTM
jgi:hypothetical protein